MNGNPPASLSPEQRVADGRRSTDVTSKMNDVLAPLLARLRSDGGRYLLSVGLTREERNAQPKPTFGGKGHQRWLTDEEYAALCALASEHGHHETSDIRAALQAFMDFQISDYYRDYAAAKRYCELRRQGRAALAGSPVESTSGRQSSTVELMNERDRVNAELARHVLGDPRESVSVSAHSWNGFGPSGPEPESPEKA